MSFLQGGFLPNSRLEITADIAKRILSASEGFGLVPADQRPLTKHVFYASVVVNRSSASVNVS
jgi:hypothetical protein